MNVSLIILCGIPFGGKTYLAKRLEKDLGCIRIDLDVIKFEMYGADIKDSGLKQSDWDRVYLNMYKRIWTSLDEGKSVIHDTGNFTVHERGLIQNIAKDVGVPYVTVFVDTPMEKAKDRLENNRQTKKRFDVPDDAFQAAVDEMEPPIKEENPIPYNHADDYAELLVKLEHDLGLVK